MARDTHILVLEQLRCPKEQRCGLLCVERLADVEEVDDAGKQGSALARAYGRFIEDAGFLDDGGLVVVVGAEAALLVLFRGEIHGGREAGKMGGPGSTTWRCTVLCPSAQRSHIIAQRTAPRGHLRCTSDTAPP